MIPALTVQQMRKCDRRAIADMGVPSLLLMERAGWGIAQLVNELIIAEQSLLGGKILLLCGPGNNGGDGLVVARHLVAQGVTVEAALFAPREKLSPDYAHNLRMAEHFGVPITMVESTTKCRSIFKNVTLVVDALFGTGGHAGLTGLYARASKIVADTALPVVAVDTPSGFSLEESSAGERAIVADFTVTLGLPKVGQLSPRFYEYSGELFWHELAYPPQAIEGQNPSAFVVEELDISQLLPKRELCAHKGDYGRLLIVAGSPGMVGAAVMAAEGALRCGAGLVKVAMPASLEAQARGLLMEAMTIPLPDEEGNFHPQAYKQLSEHLRWADVVAVGPGLGTSTGAEAMVTHLLSKRLPLVIDADGLNLLAELDEYRLPPNSVLTPHPGEMSRLIGASIDQIESKRRERAVELAQKSGAVVVLKGYGSIIAEPDGEAFINPTGGPALASGGSGDVLTGAIASFIGQGYPPLEAAVLGAYLHGLAGYVAGRELGEVSAIAGDVLDFLPEVISMMEEGDFYSCPPPLFGLGPRPIYGRATMDFMLDGELDYMNYLRRDPGKSP